MPTIIIQGTVIDFPNSAASPDWSPAVIQFAVAVAEALSGAVGTYDIVPQGMVISTAPNNTDTPITNLSFSVTQVAGAFITYTVFRNTNSTTVTETGTLEITYNGTNGIGQKWEITRVFTGDAQVSFDISDTGQVNINPSPISGSGYNAYVSYAAKTLQTSY